VTVWFEEYLDAWNVQDTDAVVGWFTDDGFYEDTTLGHSATGAAGIRRFVQASFENVSNARFEFVRGFDDGSSYAIEWVMQPMGVRGVSYGTLRDGKIAENRDYWNGKAFDVLNT
jgi:hypothetical protein